METLKKNEELYKVFQSMQSLGSLTKERNIFSIGARGYYENPTSDMLAFFLDPSSDHGLNNLVLSCLLSCLDQELTDPKPYPSLELTPEREYVTEAQNRIDLVLEGSDWVMAIENKIMHGLQNNFEDYKSHIIKKYPSKNSVFVILTATKPNSTPEGWIWLGYKKLITEIRPQLGQYMVSSGPSKWAVFLREFFLNIEDQLSLDMDKKTFEFVNTNYDSFNQARKLLDEYLTELQGEVSELCSSAMEFRVNARRESWREHGIAIRAYPWSDKINNVILLVCPDGSFEIKIYYEAISNEKVVEKNHFSSIDGSGFHESEDERVRGAVIWVFSRPRLIWGDTKEYLTKAFELLKGATAS